MKIILVFKDNLLKAQGWSVLLCGKLSVSGQHRWTGNSWVSSNAERKKEAEVGTSYPGERQKHCLGVQQWSLQSQESSGAGSSEICQGRVKGAPVSTSAAKGQPRKLWGCCSMGQETQRQRTWKRERNYFFALLFTSKICTQASQLHEPARKACRSTALPPVGRALKPSAHAQSVRPAETPPVVLW